jgi:hypothetical protein
MLKDKIEGLESRGKKSNFIGSWGTVDMKLMRADSEAKQSVKEGRDSQLLLQVADLKAQWKKKGKDELHNFCQNTKRDGEKTTLKATTRTAPLRGSAR